MKTFFKDYGHLCKEAGNFYKKHWLGSIIVSVISLVATYVVTCPKELKKDFIDDIKSKFKKDSKEEEEVE